MTFLGCTEQQSTLITESIRPDVGPEFFMTALAPVALQDSAPHLTHHNASEVGLPASSEVNSLSAIRTDPSNGQSDSIIFALDSAAAVEITDRTGTITFVNAHFLTLSGYTAAELIGHNQNMLSSGIHSSSFFETMAATLSRGAVWRGEICNRHKDGTRYWTYATIVPRLGPDGGVDHYIAILFDVTDRKRIENALRMSRAQLHQAVNIDALTSLSNRRAFTERLAHWLKLAEKEGTSLTLALIDLDHFKTINDFHGHDTGDAVLRGIGSRLRLHEGRKRIAARLGGDEFALLFFGENIETVKETLEEILISIREPLVWNGTVHRCTASIGYASTPDHGTTEEALFKGADLALYHAKTGLRNKVQVYRPAFTHSLERRMKQLAAIETGLDLRQFRLQYQPIIPVSPGEAPSVEALLRWHHPELGILTPEQFWDAFDDPETASRIGDFVLQAAIADIAHLEREGIDINRVSINLSRFDFLRASVVERLENALQEYGVSPAKIGIEVTEDVFFGKNAEAVRRELERLHERGYEISLDDFGTGFASLTHLRRVPFDIVKIDRTFTRGIATNGPETTIVNGVVSIVRGMGRRIVAEGVETAAQAAILTEMGCEMLQGWFYGRACAIESLGQLFNTIGERRLSQ